MKIFGVMVQVAQLGGGPLCDFYNYYQEPPLSRFQVNKHM